MISEPNKLDCWYLDHLTGLKSEPAGGLRGRADWSVPQCSGCQLVEEIAVGLW